MSLCTKCNLPNEHPDLQYHEDFRCRQLLKTELAAAQRRIAKLEIKFNDTWNAAIEFCQERDRLAEALIFVAEFNHSAHSKLYSFRECIASTCKLAAAAIQGIPPAVDWRALCEKMAEPWVPFAEAHRAFMAPVQGHTCSTCEALRAWEEAERKE